MTALLFWVTLIWGFFFPPIWIVTFFVVLIGAFIPSKRYEPPKPATEREYRENVRWYKKNFNIDYDEWMMKMNPHRPIPGKPKH